MNKKEHLQAQSKTRAFLIRAEIALKDNRIEDALMMLNEIKLDELSMLSLEELHALGNLINYIKILAEEKKSELVAQLKAIQASREYL